jgi:hypothetical protein
LAAAGSRVLQQPRWRPVFKLITGNGKNNQRSTFLPCSTGIDARSPDRIQW